MRGVGWYEGCDVGCEGWYECNVGCEMCVMVESSECVMGEHC